MKMRILLLIVLFSLIISPKVKALQLSADARISIITCNPGEEVYTMYGHTAIRIMDPAYGIDVVYNYGIFSFESPNFLYRFAKGQTDYLMMGQEFSSFMPEYVKEKRSVYEQVLNLSVEGKNQLFQALVENAKKENRVYRYNFFMDNCATRVRDMIEKNAGVQVRFTDNHPTKSFRDLIKEFHKPFRWFDLGIDLLVGKRADETVSAYGQMFLPEYLMNQFAKAEIVVDGKAQPLVKETFTMLDFPNYKQQSDLPWPAIAFGLIFLAVSGISVRNFLRRTKSDWLDYWLFALSGVAGLIIGWFTLFSEHPAVSPNYNLLWALPLNLFFAGIWAVKKWRPITRYYFWVSGAALLLSFVMGQHLNPAVYFIILTLLVRVAVNLIPAKNYRILVNSGAQHPNT
ncbi:MAG: DUF4105 domain-containing protein [Prolixibacteraceae bacterium]|nr:DUF4105 domain-containing protein [Prolixibacteraceae bacterium]